MWSKAAKALIALMKNEKTRNIIIALVFGGLILLMIFFVTIFNSQALNSSSLAQQATIEHQYWEKNTPEQSGFSCQGEKYCSHFNTPVVDWCCYFVGYCADSAEIPLDEIGFSPGTRAFISNLKNMNKLYDAGTYNPQIGNIVFFNYDGRAVYKATNTADHVGIIVEVDGEQITVIAGNEYYGATENWAHVSYVNKYSLSIHDDDIACYGAVGTGTLVKETELNKVVRNIICHNETGVLYSDITEEYGSILANDEGALSIGVYGWHGNNALKLLKQTYKNNKAEFVSITSSYGSAGTVIYNAVVNDSNWSSFVPNSKEKNCIVALILTDAGKQAQDDLSLQDAQTYIDTCHDNSVTNGKAVAYCCDILNQWGPYSFDRGVLDGVTASDTLESIYNSGRAWSDSNYNYYNRRTWTYNYIKGLNTL